MLPREERDPLEPSFVRECLEANERGDGVMYAALHRDRYLYNTTPKDGEWYAWDGTVWRRDDFRRSFAGVEECALEYQRMAEVLRAEIEAEGITDKKHPGWWKVRAAGEYLARAKRLRNRTGAAATLQWAPVVDESMACREEDFDKLPHLLPVKNGVVDLRTGALTSGRPVDKLTRVLDLEYNPHADYTTFAEFVREISAGDELAAFIRRSFGYGATGHSHEQHIWVFTGPGRNGKGVLFDLIASVMRPYYHVISRSMLIEQRSEPSPSAASEHLYSLLGKRIAVGGETNPGQKIDAGAVKALTGDDDIKCRPNFKSEIVFRPSHTLFLHTNHVPHGLTRDFALVQRLIKIEFPYMYVDDPEAEAKRNPTRAQFFRKKDPGLKDKLRACRQGILRWLVEGAVEWYRDGLMIPDSIRDSVMALAKEEDYTGRFVEECLDQAGPDDRMACKELYLAFRWWWAENEQADGSKRRPEMKTLNNNLRDRGVTVAPKGGITWVYGYTIKLEIALAVQEFGQKEGRNS